MTIRVAVAGATGRMGELARRLVAEADDLELHAGLDSGSPLTDLDGADVVLDVTHPAASEAIVRHAVAAGIPIVVGTSGWSAERIAGIRAYRRAFEQPGAVVFVPNFSVGSVLATALSAIAARYFDSIEIVEAHHAAKVDSPSGTAVRTAEVIAQARGEQPVEAPHADQRARGQLVAGIPVHSLRLAGVVAEQRVLFGGTGETLALTHTTTSPSAYDQGILLALRAAPDAEDITIGLDALLGLDLPVPPADA